MGKLNDVHQKVIAKRSEIEALIAEEQKLSPSMSEGSKNDLKSQVDKLLEEWEREKDEDGVVPTGSAAFNKLAREHYDLQQQILNAEDDQAEEATENPFSHPLR